MESDSRRAALLRSAQQGDGAAFDQLERDLEPLLRRFLRRLVGASSSEDDILQNAFLALYTNLERLDSEAHLLPFLYRVARNLAYDEWRRRGRYRLVELNEAAAVAGHRGDPAAPPDEQVARTMLAAEVNRAVLRLPEAQRQALILYAQEGLSYEQVAEATGTDLGTVKSRIHYARQRLRALLSQDTVALLDQARDRDGGTRHDRK